MTQIKINALHKDIQSVISFYVKHLKPDFISDITSEPKGVLKNEYATYLMDDPSGIAFWSKTTPSVRGFGNSRTYSLDEITNNPTKIDMVKKDYSDILSVIDNSELEKNLDILVEDNLARINAMASEPANEEMKGKIKEEIYDYQIFANSAFKSLSRLQILKSSTPASALTRFCDNILCIPSRQHIIELSQDAPEGLSLVAIVDKENLADSYFTLLAKTNGNVLYFSDEGDEQFPDQSSGRRTDRQAMNRIEESVFPYRLLELEVVNDRHLKLSDSTKLSTERDSPISYIGQISKLTHNELFLLSLILHDVNIEIEGNPNLPLLYNSQALLLPSKSGTGLVVSSEENRIINVPSVSSKDVSFDMHEAADKAIDARVAHPFPLNRFEGRFDDVLSETPVLNQDDSKELTINTPEYSYRGGWCRQTTFNIKNSTIAPLHKNLFGSKERVEADNIYLMRRDKAQLLKAHIYAEYENQKTEREQWIIDNTIKSPVFRSMLANLNRNYFTMLDSDKAFIDSHRNLRGMSNDYVGQLSLWRGAKYDINNTGSLDIELSNANYRIHLNRQDYKERCFITGGKASIIVMISSYDAFSLAQLLDVERESMPYDLDLTGLKNYQGNSILDRIDPVSNIELPCEEEHHAIIAGLSIKGFNQLRTEFNLSKLKRTEIEGILFPDES